MIDHADLDGAAAEALVEIRPAAVVNAARSVSGRYPNHGPGILLDAGIPLIDLRLVCDEDSDYANEIEPSEKGGGKIANAIVRLVSGHDFESHRTEVFF